MHAGLNLPNYEPDRASPEVAQVAEELSELSLGAVAHAKVAIVYDYGAHSS
jgi:beta-galactosidase